MRPSDITDGIERAIRGRRGHIVIDEAGFNEAVGYYRRNLDAVDTRGDRIIGFNEAVGYYRRNHGGLEAAMRSLSALQ